MSKNWLPAKNDAKEAIGEEEFEKLSISTRVLCSRLEPIVPGFDPIATPIFQTSVYRNTSVQHYLDIIEHGGYIYQRLGNRTVESAEVVINEMEGGKGTLLFSSGLASMSSIFLCFLKAGDHVICHQPIYSGTHKFVDNVLEKFGVSSTWIHAGCDVDEYRRAVRPNTKLIYAEVPCNPDMSLIDLEKLGALSKELRAKQGTLSAVDSTFGSPYCQQPLKYGIDMSFHSCTKYLGGHTDLIGGCVTVNDVEHWKMLKNYQAVVGNCLAPFDAYLLGRGLKTLSLRMERHSSNAKAVAEFLEAHPKVKRVYYPGLTSHPQHELARRQMQRGFSGMIALEMADLRSAKTLVEGVKVINLAVSLGGAESLIEHPATMTHGPMIMSDEDRRKSKISDGLIRFSVGLEDPQDLINDLAQALKNV